MQSLRWLIEQSWAQQALFTGLAVGTLCSLLSVVVVLKRMAFIGQGISHAGFGGVGTAVFLGLTGLTHDLVVLAFCVITALVIGALSRRRRLEADTAIGILLVAAMAWGALLNTLNLQWQQYAWYVHWFGERGYRPSFESLLFGSLLNVSALRMWLSIGCGAFILLLAAALFKEIVFFTFDEITSRVFGIRTGLIYYLLLVMLAVTVVLSMMLAGVVLVSALLVIPGATALQLSRKLGPVLVWSWVTGMVGVVGGLVLSLELGTLPSGPCMVAVLCLLFLLAYLSRSWRRAWPANAPAEAENG